MIYFMQKQFLNLQRNFFSFEVNKMVVIETKGQGESI